MNSKLIIPFSDRYQDFIKDESRLHGQCSSISFPKTPRDVQEIFEYCVSCNIPLTVQGARTGISGCAVPYSGHVMSTENFNQILGAHIDEENNLILSLLPGVSLSQVHQILQKGELKNLSNEKPDLEEFRNFRFSPNPTETTASFGGLFACNAKGMNYFRYGDTASNIDRIEILLTSGELWEVPRGRYIFDNSGCMMPNGERLEINLSEIINTHGKSGLLPQPGLDLLDLFAGSEGMLGILTEIDICLQKAPEFVWGILFFFETLSGAVDFSLSLYNDLMHSTLPLLLSACELLHVSALKLIEEYKANVSALRDFPTFPIDAEAAIYVEIEGDDDLLIDQQLESLLEKFVKVGGKDEHTWAVSGVKEVEKFHLLRHAAAESANLVVDKNRQKAKSITKTCTDFSGPMEYLAKTLNLYLQGLQGSGLQYSIFGHVFENHFHVNLLPKNEMELKRANDLIVEWAEQINVWGGLVVSENGIGKLKKPIFNKIVTDEELQRLITVKDYFDPLRILNPNNMIDHY